MNTRPTLKPLRFGIMSTAKIAHAFCKGNVGNPRVQITAVASRSLDSAQEFAKQHGIHTAWGSYEALLADSNVDAVYIPLPNHLHASWAIRAAQCGKHVLCEKPLAMSQQEAQAMFMAAKEAGVMLLEGYPYWFQPHLRQVLHWLHGETGRDVGEAGAVRSMHAHFSFPMVNRAGDIRARPETGGGALGDLGCYVMSLAHLVMRDSPMRLHAVPVWTTTDPRTRVDISMAIHLEYAGGRSASLTCSMAHSLERRATIYTERGVIETGFPNHTSAQEPGLLKFWRGPLLTELAQATTAELGNGFYLEAQKFADIVQSNDVHAMHQAQEASLAVARLLDAAKQSANSGQAVEWTVA
jgi:predicted dehydrogenase